MSDIVITGASGMLGRALMIELAKYNPVGTALSRTRGGLERLDLVNTPGVTTFLKQHRPKIIIHAAAERRPDVSEAEPENTAALNVGATTTIARVAREIGAFVLYLSTDYVFDGTRPPYKPGDAPNPLNFYGQTKLQGEQALFATLEDAASLRVGVLFGTVENTSEGAVTALVDAVRLQKPKMIDDWARRYPTYIPDVAVVIRKMIEYRSNGGSISGKWHWCGNEQYTKYAQALMIGEILGLPTAHLTADPNPALGAPRPYDCHLDCSALEDLGLGQRTPFRVALTDALRSSGII